MSDKSDGDDSDEWTGIPVTRRTKRRFGSFKREVEAARDEDMSQNDLVNWLLNESPDPSEVDA